MGYFTCKFSITCPSPLLTNKLVSKGWQNRSTLNTWNWNESTTPPRNLTERLTVQSQREQRHLTFHSHRFPRFQSVSVFCFLIGGGSRKKSQSDATSQAAFPVTVRVPGDRREACLMNSSIHREPCVIPLCTSTQGATERGEKGKKKSSNLQRERKTF